jgi:hypothetical protein
MIFEACHEYSIARRLQWLAVFSGLLLFVGSGRPAMGQRRSREAPVTKDTKLEKKGAEAGARSSGPGVKAPGVKVERDASGKRVYRITTGIVIEGRIQKPNAFYVLQRSQINYDWSKLKKDFIPRILDAVNRQPF